MRTFTFEVGHHPHFAVRCVDGLQAGRLANPRVATIGANQQFCRQFLAIRQRQHDRFLAHFNGARHGRAKQAKVALPLDVFPQLDGHQRRFKDPAEFRHARFIGGKVQLRTTVTVDFHGVNGGNTLGIQMLPHTDLLQKIGVCRSDGIDTRIPSCDGSRHTSFHEGDPEARIAQGTGQRKSSQTTADDDNIKRH